MKNRKILACLLSAIMVFSLMSPVFAENEQSLESVVDMDYSADYDFALSVGIMPDDVNPSAAIKRIELAKCFTNVLIPDYLSEGDTASKYFSDVDYTNSGYADTVAGAGIMNGVGNGLFNPEGFVTYTQLIKAFVSFLGYDVKAQSMGGYPAGYMAVASTLGLVGISSGSSPENFVTGEMVATMFKRAINSPVFVKTEIGEEVINYVERSDINYLSKYMSIYRLRGVVRGVHGTNLADDLQLKYNEIMVNTTKMSYNAEKMDLSQKLGLSADVYYRINNGKAEIAYFEEFRNNVLKVSGENISGYSGGIIYYEGTKELKIPTDGYVQVLYNNTLCTSYTEAVLNPWKDGKFDGGVTAIDNNSDGTYDYILIDAYETFTVSSVIDNKIIPMYRDNMLIDLKPYTDGEDVIIRNLLGEPVSLESIENGSVISVSKNLAGEVKSVVVTIDTFTGILDSLEIVNGEYFFTFGNETYKPSKSLKNNPQLSKIETGRNIKLMFNKDGLVSDVEALKFQVNSIGYITDAKEKEGLGGGFEIRVFTAGGVFEVFSFAKRVNTFYGLENSPLTPEQVLAKIGYTSGGRIVRQPILYRKNADGEINWISICNNADGAIDGFYKFHGTILPETSGNLEYRSAPVNTFGGKFLVSGTTYFAIPSEENRDVDEDYKIVSPYPGIEYSMEAYGIRKNSRVASLVVFDADQFKSKSSNTSGTVVVVSDVRETLDADGYPAVKLKGLVAKNEVEYFGVEEELKVAPGGALPECGDVLRVTLKKNDMIDTIEFIFDESSKTMPGYSSNPTGGYAKNPRYLYGEIVWSDEESMMVNSVSPSSGAITTEVYMKPASYAYYKVKNIGGKKTLSLATAADFMAYPGEESKSVFMHSVSGDPKMFVLYE